MILRIIGYLVALFVSVLISELVLSLGLIFLQRNVKRPRFSLYIFIFQSFLKGVAAVLTAFVSRVMRCRESAQTRSARIGFRLYAIALDPICSRSVGSSTSSSCCNNRKSVANLEADWPMPLKSARIRLSSFLVYVCPLTGIESLKPNRFATALSRPRTFSWSPWNRSR